MQIDADILEIQNQKTNMVINFFFPQFWDL